MPDNRPDCQQLLHKINEFSIEISLVIKDTSIYEEIKIVLEKENNYFLKNLLFYKTNEKYLLQHNYEWDESVFYYLSTVESLKSVLFANSYMTISDDTESIWYTLSKLLTLFEESPKTCSMFLGNDGMDLCQHLLIV